MLKAWFMAMRPWSFTAAFVPVAVGTALAASQGHFNPWLFLLTVLGGISVQAGTNFINTYGDYQSGVDTVDSAHTCPQLVTGAMRPADMKKAGLFAFGFAALIGLYLSWLCGWEIFVVGLVGILGGYTYTAGPCPFKYRGLGSLFVFFLMGPLMAWPAWFIQTGRHDWTPLLVAVPVGFLVSAILNGNDVRDIAHDRAAGIATLAIGLGGKRGLLLQRLLYWGAFVSLLTLVALKLLPVSALLPFALLPIFRKTLHTLKEAEAGRNDRLLQLEGMAAGFHFQFGVLLAFGLALQPWLAGKGL
ncbi:MAG TPA: 1,4-dihydroxy-2-naphthoate octaprenyltransferase [Negativicutes bacterium]|nr:1,4-dihydroxy-2-naphthoate octaprenyltransferase [Negativicutes bacterium]